MAFDINGFYSKLDEYYGRYDNAATEKFLLDSLAQAEEFMIIPSSCSSCLDHGDHTGEEKFNKLSEEEKKWIIECSDSRIAILNEIACFYRGVSSWEKCLSAFNAVKDEMEARGLEHINSYAVVILNMAGAFRLMGRFDDALAAFHQAEEILTRTGNAGDYELAGLYNNMGLVYQDLKELGKAAENFEKALTYLVRVPDNDAEIATNNANLALTYYNAGKSDKAIECLDRAISIFETLDGGLNPHYAGALNTKAVILFNSGDIAGAAAMFADAAAKTKLIFGENKDYAVGCRNAAYAYSKLGDTAKAEEYMSISNAVEAKLG